MIWTELLRHASDAEFGVGASVNEVRATEAVVDLRIRGEYRIFLLGFGWAAVEHLEVFGLGSNVPLHLNLVRATQWERTEAGLPLPHALLPIANDGFGNLFCLDTLDPAAEPPVVLWNHESGSDLNPIRVEASFGFWLCSELNVVPDGHSLPPKEESARARHLGEVELRKNGV